MLGREEKYANSLAELLDRQELVLLLPRYRRPLKAVIIFGRFLNGRDLLDIVRLCCFALLAGSSVPHEASISGMFRVLSV